MATATKTPAKRAASQTRTASAVKTVPTRTGAAVKGASKTVLKSASASVKGALAQADGPVAGNGAAASRKASKRVTNGAAGPAAHTIAKPSRARVKGNGELPPELAGDVQELARDTLHEGEVVRKTRASTDTEVAVPVQTGGLVSEVTRPAYWDKACVDL